MPRLLKLTPNKSENLTHEHNLPERCASSKSSPQRLLNQVVGTALGTGQRVMENGHVRTERLWVYCRRWQQGKVGKNRPKLPTM